MTPLEEATLICALAKFYLEKTREEPAWFAARTPCTPAGLLRLWELHTKCGNAKDSNGECRENGHDAWIARWLGDAA